METSYLPTGDEAGSCGEQLCICVGDRAIDARHDDIDVGIVSRNDGLRGQDRNIIRTILVPLHRVLEPGHCVGSSLRDDDAISVAGNLLKTAQLNSAGEERVALHFFPQVRGRTLIGTKQEAYSKPPFT
jgi:hypothetical protein